MKSVIIFCTIIAAFSGAAFAQDPLFMDRDTIDNSRARYGAERYEQYKQNNYQAPLGGYHESFGSTAPVGTIQPGYASSPQNYVAPSPNLNNGLIGGSQGNGY